MRFISRLVIMASLFLGAASGASAQAADCQTVVGMFGESALGTLAALQLSSILPPRSLPAETTWFLAMTEQITHEPLKIKDGAIQLPNVAGLS